MHDVDIVQCNAMKIIVNTNQKHIIYIHPNHFFINGLILY